MMWPLTRACFSLSVRNVQNFSEPAVTDVSSGLDNEASTLFALMYLLRVMIEFLSMSHQY